MANKAYSLSRTKWMCKYRIVFTPKYKRKVIYGEIRSDIGEILRRLREYKCVEIMEGHLSPTRGSFVVCRMKRQLQFLVNLLHFRHNLLVAFVTPEFGGAAWRRFVIKR